MAQESDRRRRRQLVKIDGALRRIEAQMGVDVDRRRRQLRQRLHDREA
jgi:hypothetical protein